MLSIHSRDSKQAHDVVGRPAMLPVQGSHHPTPVQESRGNLAFSFKHQDEPWDSISEIRWKGIYIYIIQQDVEALGDCR